MPEEVHLLDQYLQPACSVLTQRLLVPSGRCTNKPHNEERHNEFDHVDGTIFHGFAFRFLATLVGFRPAGTRFLVRGAAGGVVFRLRIWW